VGRGAAPRPSSIRPIRHGKTGLADAVKTLPAGLLVFRTGDDGRLTFVRKYDVDVGAKVMFGMGMVPPLTLRR
jgi:hypothetical protein